jgi:ubiquitin carboxyl-terminal hydrolase 7
VYSTPATEATVPDSEPRPVYSIIFALQIVFWKLQTETKEVSPDELTQAFGWTTVDSYMQQDVQEMMRILLDKLEELMKGTVVDGVIGGLFQGKIRSYIR